MTVQRRQAQAKIAARPTATNANQLGYPRILGRNVWGKDT